MKKSLTVRSIALGLFILAASALQAPAESVLYRGGTWQVTKSTDSTGEICDARNVVSTRSMHLLSRAASPNSVIFSLYPLKDFAGNGYNTYLIQIDQGVLHTFRRGHLLENLYNYTLPHQEWSVHFLTEISVGKSLLVMVLRGRELYQIDIAGAGPAIQSFVKCSAGIWGLQ